MFSKFPTYTFIWKYEADLPEAASHPNLLLTKWVPQNDMFGEILSTLLCIKWINVCFVGHPKMKGFITHAGYNSLLEASNAGIPLVMIPLFGDQAGNRRKAERHGIAIGIDKHEITTERLTSALEQILTNST